MQKTRHKSNLESIVHLRLEKDLEGQLQSEAAALGYRNLSPYLRVILLQRRTPGKAGEGNGASGVDSGKNGKGSHYTDLPAGAITAIEHLCSEVRRIGVLYNQFVAAYNKAVLLRDSAGQPCVSVRETQRNQLGLMELTLELTDRMHSLLDYFRVPHNRSRIYSAPRTAESGLVSKGPTGKETH